MGTIKATDAEGDNMTFDMVNNGDIFGLDARNGKLVVNDDLDFETTQSYTLKVSVSDGKLSSNADITVNVTDVDENQKPVIADQTFSIAENTASGVDIGTIVATDPNMTDDLTFTITAGNADGVFALNRSTGVLSTAGALDFETASTYTLKVSVSDGELSSNADITVNVTDVEEAAEPGDRLPAKDINALTAAGNENPQDIWSDGITIWVSDSDDAKLYAYTLATGERDAAKDIDLAADNTSPIGLWSDGITIWVLDDSSDEKLYVYTLATGVRDESKEFDLALPKNFVNFTGIWSDGTTLWIADAGFANVSNDEKIYAYTLATGARDTAKDINTLSVTGDEYLTGLWSDGTTLWVTDRSNTKLYAYTLATGTRDADKEFDLDADNSLPEGIWSDGTTVWVVNQSFFGTGDTKIYAYAIETTTPAPTPAPASVPSPGTRLPVQDISTATGNADNWGLWSDGTTIWVLDEDDAKLYAYTLATKVRDATKEFDLAAENDDPTGIWSDGTTLWVVQDGFFVDDDNDKLYAYTLATKVRDAAKDIDLAAENDKPTGIWSDNTTIWVAQDESVGFSSSGSNKLYAYTLATKVRDAAKEFDLAADNTDPKGIWSDETTLWVVQDGFGFSGIDKLYAYTLDTKVRDAAKEFDLAAGNNTPIGIWSDGTTIWVTQEGFGGNDKLYAYQLK
ncbi:MAG: cadherin repeat domain-containing protein [Ekhidna sp.]|nr:cadherin repeat domain-containing protein [Ekhidna sp.]